MLSDKELLKLLKDKLIITYRDYKNLELERITMVLDICNIDDGFKEIKEWIDYHDK